MNSQELLLLQYAATHAAMQYDKVVIIAKGDDAFFERHTATQRTRIDVFKKLDAKPSKKDIAFAVLECGRHTRYTAADALQALNDGVDYAAHVANMPADNGAKAWLAQLASALKL